MPLRRSSLPFVPFTLGVGLLSRVFGALGDKIGARAMLIAGPAGAALAYVLMALGQEASLMLLTLRPVDTLDLSRTIAFQAISGSGTAAALRQLRMLVERYAWS
jgi:MFS family permease